MPPSSRFRLGKKPLHLSLKSNPRPLVSKL
jgi:hypothetical protein